MLSDYINQDGPAPNPLLQPCGLDTLHLAVAQTVPFTRHFEGLRKQLARTGRKEDYRSLGLPVVMLNPLYGRKASRILQIVGVGNMGKAAITDILRSVVEWQPLDLRIYRVDLTADWIGSTLADWRKSVRVRRKRNSTQFQNPNRPVESLEAQRHESGRYETLYFGSTKSSDYLRVYDKTAQLRSTGNATPGVVVPSPWVRFERVLAGDKIPDELKTLGALLQNGSAFDPFGHVEVSAAYDVSANHIYEWAGPLNQRMNAAWTLHMIQTCGRFEAARRIRAEQRKPKELFDLLDRILADDVSVSALNRLRNKQGVTLNLKHPEARCIYGDLVKRADVIVENFSRGTLDRLGAGHICPRTESAHRLLLHHRLRKRGRSGNRQSDGRDHPGIERRHDDFGRSR